VHSEKDGLLDHIAIFAPAPEVTPSPVETTTEIPTEAVTLDIPTEAPATGTQIPLPGLIALIAMRKR